MKIAVLKENKINEKRVSVTPCVVKKYVDLGINVTVEKGAGEGANCSDEAYIAAGAKISSIPLELVADADIILKINLEESSIKDHLSECNLAREKALVIGLFNPFSNAKLFKSYNEKKLTSLALEFIPRISRAQSMDVLSSQSNLVGYRAVLEAATNFGKIFPMMMTAAGTITPARALILGAGVAGLQAIATAKRLGAIVSAFDVRSASKEQVESLGANFIEVAHSADAETKGGYAKEMNADYQEKQKALIAEHIKKSDIVISTALIPGKPAPLLITADMVKSMKPGSVIVDIATASGGNCELSKHDEIISVHNVTIIGDSNLASKVAFDASRLYANNIFHLISLIYDKNEKSFKLNMEDEIIKSSLITHNGEIVNSKIQG